MSGERINPYKMFAGAFIPTWLLERTEVSQGAKLTYAQLARYAGQNGVAWPKLETLAKDIGVKARQVGYYLTELKNQALIETEQPGRGHSNHYFFLAHPWMDASLEWQDTASLEWQDTTGLSERESVEENHSSLLPHPLVVARKRAAPSSEEQQIRTLWTEEGLGTISMNALSRLRKLVAAHGVSYVQRGIREASEQNVKYPVSWMETVIPAWKREDANGRQGQGSTSYPRTTRAQPGNFSEPF